MKKKRQKNHRSTAIALLVLAGLLNFSYCTWTQEYEPHSARSLAGIRGFIGVSAKSPRNRRRDMLMGIACPTMLVVAAGFFQSRDGDTV